MAQNNMEAMLLGAPTDEEKARLMAEALRGRQGAADLFGMSTIGQIAQGAQADSANTQDAAKRGGILRQAALQKQQQAEQNAASEARMSAQNAATNDYRNRQLKQSAEQAALDRASRLSIAQLKDEGGAGRVNPEDAKLEKMPASERPKYRAAKTMAETFPDIIEQVEKSDGKAFGQGTSPKEYMPDWMPNVASESLQRAREDKFTPEQLNVRNQVYREAYKVIKDLAGTALSAHEASRIQAFMPAPNASKQVVLANLKAAQAEAARQHASFNIYGGGGQIVDQGTDQIDDYDNMTDEQLDSLLMNGG